MRKFEFNLVLDKDQLNKSLTYYIYRSEEKTGNHPTVDGVYIQRVSVGANPPEKMSLSLDWE